MDTYVSDYSHVKKEINLQNNFKLIYMIYCLHANADGDYDNDDE